MSKLQNQQGAHVVVSGCSTGKRHRPLRRRPRPRRRRSWDQRSRSTRSWAVWRRCITDRSGVSSQCTYATDNYNRSFALPANATYDLKIVPAVPRFKNWNVTISCDNGTSTQAATYF